MYDWAILLLPAILLWQQRTHDWSEIFALVWFATFASSTLTGLQLKVLPFAVQLSVRQHSAPGPNGPLSVDIQLAEVVQISGCLPASVGVWVPASYGPAAADHGLLSALR
jgi:hypothetical protein